MRLAQINLPILDNDGNSLQSVHDALQRDLCQFFGGFTVFEGKGAWMDGEKLYQETVMVYQIAYDADADGAPDLIRAMARDYGKAAKQIAVFVSVDGEANIFGL